MVFEISHNEMCDSTLTQISIVSANLPRILACLLWGAELGHSQQTENYRILKLAYSPFPKGTQLKQLACGREHRLLSSS